MRALRVLTAAFIAAPVAVAAQATPVRWVAAVRAADDAALDSAITKLEGFLAVPKIKECLLVNEDEMRVEHYARQNAKQWIYRIYNEREDVITLESINCKLSLAEVYAQIKLKESELSSKAVN